MPAEIIKFDEFELDLGRYELRRRGQTVKLEKVPMELLILLAQREGQLVTREEIIQKLWGNDVYLDTRQGINTAVRKIRLALHDDPDDPRILLTVIGKGYRLLAPLAVAEGRPEPASNHEAKAAPVTPISRPGESGIAANSPALPSGAAATPPRRSFAETTAISPSLARGLFLFIQFGYLVFYAATFIWFSDIRRMGLPSYVPFIVLITALVGAAARIYLMSAVGFGYAGAGRLFCQMFPAIVILDALWAASPLLLFPKLGYLTLLFVAALAFLPFSQRTLAIWAWGSPGFETPSSRQEFQP